MATKPVYTYKIVEVVKIIDGDTIDIIIDLGFHVSIKKRVRLYGINTPETRTRDLQEKKLGLEAKARLQQLCETQDKNLILKCHGLGKYGRVLGEIYNPEIFENTSVNSILLAEGHAEEYL